MDTRHLYPLILAPERGPEKVDLVRKMLSRVRLDTSRLGRGSRRWFPIPQTGSAHAQRSRSRGCSGAPSGNSQELIFIEGLRAGMFWGTPDGVPVRPQNFVLGSPFEINIVQSALQLRSERVFRARVKTRSASQSRGYRCRLSIMPRIPAHLELYL